MKLQAVRKEIPSLKVVFPFDWRSTLNSLGGQYARQTLKIGLYRVVLRVSISLYRAKSSKKQDDV